jgi:hypothetical protein
MARKPESIPEAEGFPIRLVSNGDSLSREANAWNGFLSVGNGGWWAVVPSPMRCRRQRPADGLCLTTVCRPRSPRGRVMKRTNMLINSSTGGARARAQPAAASAGPGALE